MIVFEKLVIKNFLSIQEAELVLQKGITFVKGVNLDDSKSTSNAAGKTAIFDALYWVLYGETSKGKSADSIINKQSGRETSVGLYFSKLEDKYVVTRHRKHSIFGDDLRVELNGKDITVKGLRQSQDLLLKILGIQKNFFDSTIFLTQGFSSRFSLLSETERRLMFEKIRNVEIWDKAREIASTKAANLDKELIQSRAKISVYVNENIPSLEKDIERNKQQMQEYSVKLQELKPDYSQVENLNSTLTIELQKQQAITNKKQLINSEIELKKKALIDLDPQRKEVRKKYDSVLTIFQQSESELKYIPIGDCKICGKKTEEFYTDKINELKNRISGVRQQKEELSLQVKQQEDSYQEINSVVQSLYQKNSSIDYSLSQSLVLTEQVKSQLQEIDSVYERNKQLIIQKLEDSEKNISQTEEKILNLQNLVQELTTSSEKLNENYGVYKELDKVFSPKGIRSYIIAQDLETVNSSMQDYSEYFFSNAKARLVFKGETLESSKISIELEDSNEVIFDYTDCSGGQARRIDLLIQLSIRDLVFSISNLNANVLILDEIFDSLDNEGRLSVLNLIQTNYKDYCVYVISHIPDLPYEYFDNQLTLTKLNGITTVS